MADDNKNNVPGGAQKPPEGLRPGEVAVPQSVLEAIQKQLGELELKVAETENKNAGLEQLLADKEGASPVGDQKLREKKSFEPKFRVARLRKYPIAGGPETGYVVGWSSRGAYQEVDRSGVAPQMIDYIDIMFLGRERNTEGKIQVEKIKLLDLLNKGEQITCKVLNVNRQDRKEPTGEEINVTVFDPQHGLMATGDIIDGYITTSDINVTLQIPGVTEPVEVDSKYINA